MALLELLELLEFGVWSYLPSCAPEDYLVVVVVVVATVLPSKNSVCCWCRAVSVTVADTDKNRAAEEQVEKYQKHWRLGNIPSRADPACGDRRSGSGSDHLPLLLALV